MRFIDNAWQELHRLWSIRVSMAFGAFTAVAGGIGFFANTLNPWFLLVVSVLVNAIALPLLRLAKQAEPPTT
jgi:hypothetical protein